MNNTDKRVSAKQRNESALEYSEREYSRLSDELIDGYNANIEEYVDPAALGWWIYRSVGFFILLVFWDLNKWGAVEWHWTAFVVIISCGRSIYDFVSLHAERQVSEMGATVFSVCVTLFAGYVFVSSVWNDTVALAFVVPLSWWSVKSFFKVHGERMLRGIKNILTIRKITLYLKTKWLYYFKWRSHKKSWLGRSDSNIEVLAESVVDKKESLASVKAEDNRSE